MARWGVGPVAVLCASLFVWLAPAMAAEETGDGGFPGEIVANLALASSYTYRGIVYTDHEPAVQGGLDWFLGDVYLGVWGSNLEGADLELDVYAGYAPQWNGTHFNFLVVYYTFPGAEDDFGEWNYVELWAEASRAAGPFEATLSAIYTPEFYYEAGEAVYLEGRLGLPIGSGFKLNGSLGHQWVEDNLASEDGTFFGAPDYFDWSLGVSYDWRFLTFDARYVDTDIDKADCFFGTDLCDPRGVFSVKAVY